MQQYARVEVDNQPQEDLETQSIATSVSRFMNYRVTSRNAFYARNAEGTRSGRTLLVPDTSRPIEEIFRNTHQTNFTRTGALSVRTDENDNEIRNDAPVVDDAENSNGFSTYRGQQAPIVAKYKIIKDAITIGDQRLMNQESISIKNIHNLIFFFIVVIVLCV